MESVSELALLSFDAVCALVVDTLKDVVPMAMWSVTRHVEGRLVHLTVRDDAYGLAAGGEYLWSDSLCQYAVTGRGPMIAPDAMAVPLYAAAGVAGRMTIGAFVGVPIRAADGTVYGSICGLDPQVAGPELAAQRPPLTLLADLLGQVIQSEALRERARDREAELHRLAFSDPLTDLPNRALFLDRAEQAVRRRRRTPAPLAVLLIDLDDFKAVNDTYGHAAGDQLLVDVAQRIGSALRAGDTLARLGGDEFAVLVEDGGEALPVARRVVAALERAFDVAGHEVLVRCSVGVAELPMGDPAMDVDVLLARADVAMYAAKRSGGSEPAVYDPRMTLPAGDALRLREPLRQAIETGAIDVWFQAIVELGNPEVTSFESLARWEHEGVRIPPDVFVPVAARSGLLPALTTLVLERACTQLASWTAQGHPDVMVGINVSPDSLVDPHFPDQVAGALTRHGLSGDRLVLEITEDALLRDLPAAQEVTHRLAGMGLAMSLDDFGTGFSSLMHLRRIPLATFKIDRSFVHDLDTDPDAERFVGALLALGRDLGMDVVVEGVERATQVEVLHRLGARYVQGWLFAAAVRADAVQWTTRHAGAPPLRVDSPSAVPMLQ